MKKILAVLLVCLISLAVFAAAPTKVTVDGSYYWERVSPTWAATVSATYALVDTSVDPDSVFFLRNFVPDKGYEYVLTRGTSTGTGGDTVAQQVIINCKGTNKEQLYQVVADTFTLAAGEAVVLPFGQTAIGVYYDVFAKSYTNYTGKTRIYQRVGLYKRAPWQYHK
jgi:hypothetical protein